jgi:hypothetical protein
MGWQSIGSASSVVPTTDCGSMIRVVPETGFQLYREELP